MGSIRVLCSAVLLLAGSTAAVAQSAPSDGIKVHGEWALTVRNADGSVAALHQFKNALNTGVGADVRLANLLLGTEVPGKWFIALGMIPDDACGGAGCYIAEITMPAAQSLDLSKAVPATGPDAGKFVLRGSVRVSKNASIAIVSTSLGTCAAPVTPQPCTNVGQEFTRRALSPGIAVSAGQLVEVKVVISFS